MCRIHGSDGLATQPQRWHGKKSHAKHVVPTTAPQFAHAISSGLAARDYCYVQHDIRQTRAGQRLMKCFQDLGDAMGLALHPQYGALVNIWWGPCGHTEPLHVDVTEGTLCQLRGKKRVVLFPPTAWRDLHPFPVSGSGMSWAFSQVPNVLQRAAEAELLLEFPDLGRALPQRMELQLDEGEVLFIPACCAHEIAGESAHGTEPADHVLSVNRFWATDPANVLPHLPADARREYERGLVGGS